MPGIDGKALIVFDNGESVSLGGEACSLRRLPKVVAGKLSRAGYREVDCRLEGGVLRVGTTNAVKEDFK